MKGPPPKDPKLRQRRNKASTRATLAAESDGDAVVGRLSPALPERSSNEAPWHPETVKYWQEVWASPMAAEYIHADVPGLVLLFKLIDLFNYGHVELAGEIRLQRQCFGLTSLDRRRLQWEIERVRLSARRGQPPPAASTPNRGKGKPVRDPRSFLKAVK